MSQTTLYLDTEEIYETGYLLAVYSQSKSSVHDKLHELHS